MWDVDNPKGRVASVLSVVIWAILTIVLLIRGVWDTYSILVLVVFLLLLALSFIRVYQEWKEEGAWLD